MAESANRFVSNKLVLDLFKKKDEHCDYTIKTAYGWLIEKYGNRWPEEPPTVQAVSKSVKQTEARLTRLKKQHNGPKKDAEIKAFLKQNFSFQNLDFTMVDCNVLIH